MLMKKKNDKNDKVWNVVSFDQHSTAQSKSCISVEMVPEEGICDDILSNASSDESELPVNPLKQSTTALSFETLSANCGGSGVLQAVEDSRARPSATVPPFFSRLFANLKTWHIVVLTSSTTVLLTFVVQALLRSQITEPTNEMATVPYFTDHGATFKNVDFVLPFAEASESTSKYIVDFENRVAYPIVSDVLMWDSVKFGITQKAARLRSNLDNFKREHLRQLDEKLNGTRGLIKRSFRESRESFAKRIKLVSSYLKPIQFHMGVFRNQLAQNIKVCAGACQSSSSSLVKNLRGVQSHLTQRFRSIPNKLGTIGPTLKANWAEVRSTSITLRHAADAQISAKWRNTMNMLNFRKQAVAT